MKLEQGLATLRRLDDQAITTFRRANEYAEQRLSPRLLAKAIGVLLVANSLTAGIMANGSENNDGAKPAVAPCAPAASCLDAFVRPDLPRRSPTAMSTRKAPKRVLPTPAVTTTPPKPVAHAQHHGVQSLAGYGGIATLKRGTMGADVSFPNCDTPIRSDATFGVVGVNGGRPFTTNNCLATEAARFKHPGLYVNASLDYDQARSQNDPSIKCPLPASRCASYRWGYRAGQFAVTTARQNGVVSREWYVDVETANSWEGDNLHQTKNDYLQNRASIEGTMDAIRQSTAQTVGVAPSQIYEAVYSNKRMWGIITGGWQLPQTQVWYATGQGEAQAADFCDKPMADFTGGGVVMVQTQNDSPAFPYSLDINIHC